MFGAKPNTRRDLTAVIDKTNNVSYAHLCASKREHERVVKGQNTMPDFPDAVTPHVRETVSIGFVDVSGQRSNTIIADVPPTVTAGEVEDLREAFGNISNAGVVNAKATAEEWINVTDAVTHDEAFASVSQRLVFVAQNADGAVRSVSVPAPDLSLFHANRTTVNRENALIIAAIAEVENVINGGDAGSGTYEVVRVYRSEVTRRLPREHDVPELIEPDAESLPPGNPALPPPEE
jgi:hypothetical protein